MRKIQLAIFSLLLFLSATSNAQVSIDNAFLHIKGKYDFNLPQLEVALSLPSMSGFRTMMYSKQNVFTSMQDDYVDYFFNSSTIDSSERNFIYFCLSDDDIRLKVNIMRGEAEVTKMAVSQRADFDSYLPSIQTRNGKSTAYKAKQGNSYSDIHIVNHNGYSYIFSLNSNLDKNTKKDFEKIIQSFRHKKRDAVMLMYTNRVNSGYFDKEAKKSTIPIAYDELIKAEGKTTDATTFDFEKLNYSLFIPEGFNYSVSGKQITDIDKNSFRVELEGVDLIKNSMIFQSFDNSDIFLFCRHYFNDKVDAKAIVEGQSANATYSKTGTINIDGVELPCVLYGTKEYASFDFYYQTDNIQSWISISGVTKASEGMVDELLSGMKFNDDSFPKKGSKPTNKPFTSLFKMDEPKAIELDIISLPEFDNENTSVCKLTGLSLELSLLGDADTYQYRVNGKDYNLTRNTIEEMPESENDRISLFSLSQPGIGYNISKYNYTYSLEELTTGAVRSYRSYKMIKILQAGIVSYNGLRWSVLNYQQGEIFVSMLRTYKDGYEILISISAQSEEELNKKIASIQYFKAI